MPLVEHMLHICTLFGHSFYGHSWQLIKPESNSFFFCSVIGAVILSIGLYVVLWGKAKEEEIMTDDDSGLSSLGPLSSTVTVPLLQS